MAKILESTLIAMCKNPETSDLGFKHLISEYKEKLYWQIKRIVEYHDDTDEVLQNVWIKIWQNIANFKEESALSTWIYRITYNESISYLQSKKKLKLEDWETSEPILTDINISQSNDSEQDEKEQMLQKIEKAIESLPQKQKLIFQYRYYEELPYAQIAAITGTSEGALKASFHHAVKKIDDLIKKN